MPLRLKLLFLSLGTQFLIALALALNWAITSPADELQIENSQFQKAAHSASVLQGEANKLATVGLISQYEVYKLALHDYQEAVGRLADLKKLAAINDTMKEALQAVARLQAGSAAPFQKISTSVENIVKDFEALGVGTSNDPPLLSLISASYNVNAGTDNARALVQFHVGNLMRDLRNGNDSLSTMVAVISAKNEVVVKEVTGIRTSSTLLAAFLMVFAFVLSIVLSLRSASNIAKAVKNLGQTGAVLAGGDLTQRFAWKRKDEIGTLGLDLNGMLDKLNASLGRIQVVAEQNRQMRESLLSIATESTSSAVQIDANSESIKNQMLRIDRMIEEDIGTISGIVNAINKFHERMDEQNQRVAESAGAVSHMIASIETIDRITEQNRKSAQALVTESEQSQEVFERSFQTVADIAEHISTIQDMADVIAGIAGQTNILAMNASIEAAHAGESGKGFSVVADEITTLATASAQSSKEIARTITAIVEKMTEANASSQVSIASFRGVSGRIRDVSESMAQVYSSVNEMQAKSRQILGAMASLQSTSTEMTGESAQIERSAKNIGQSMDDLGRISHEIVASVEEIAIGMRLITTSVQNLTEQSERMGGLGEQLDDSVSAFKTTQVSGPT